MQLMRCYLLDRRLQRAAQNDGNVPGSTSRPPSSNDYAEADFGQSHYSCPYGNGCRATTQSNIYLNSFRSISPSKTN